MKEEELRKEADRILAENMPSPTVEGMNAAHEMYVSIRAAGFSKFEALWLIGYVLTGGSIPPEERGQT